MMIKEAQHRVGELVRIIRVRENPADVITMRLRSVKSGRYLNFSTGEFEETVHTFTLNDLWDSDELSIAELSMMKPISGEFLAEFYVNDDPDGYEIHRFGAAESVYDPSTCRVYGSLKDVTGAPLSGQRVDVVLSNGGYFPHKSSLISTSTYALTDSSGYFEIELVHGLDVVISIPAIGFTQRGIIPPVAQVEIKNLMGRM